MSVAGARKGLWFSIHIENEEFVAFISADALRAHFKASDGAGRQMMRAYRENRTAIESMARRRFLDGAARPIRLEVSDFR
jgi:hypothetical protein